MTAILMGRRVSRTGALVMHTWLGTHCTEDVLQHEEGPLGSCAFGLTASGQAPPHGPAGILPWRHVLPLPSQLPRAGIFCDCRSFLTLLFQTYWSLRDHFLFGTSRVNSGSVSNMDELSIQSKGSQHHLSYEAAETWETWQVVKHTRLHTHIQSLSTSPHLFLDFLIYLPLLTVVYGFSISFIFQSDAQAFDETFFWWNIPSNTLTLVFVHAFSFPVVYNFH